MRPPFDKEPAAAEVLGTSPTHATFAQRELSVKARDLTEGMRQCGSRGHCPEAACCSVCRPPPCGPLRASSTGDWSRAASEGRTVKVTARPSNSLSRRPQRPLAKWEGEGIKVTGRCLVSHSRSSGPLAEPAADMNSVVFASCLLALVAAEPGYLGGAHLAYNAVPVAAAVSSQYHAQDELGQYSYGYSGDTSAKHETRTLDGITRGGYSYLDAHGLVQSASYVSDPFNGFRVAATNLPVGPSAPAPAVVAPAAVAVNAAPYAAVHAAPYAAVNAAPYAALNAVPYAAVHAAPVAVAGAPLPVVDTPEVAAAKLAHFQAHAAAKGHLLGRKKRSPGYLGAAGYGLVGAAGHGLLAAPAAAAVLGAPARSFGYSTVAAHAAPAVVAASPAAISTYAAVAPAAAAVLAAPARSFGYSTVAAHAAPAVVAAAPAAISTYAAVAPAAAAVLAAPARSFAYSSVAAGPLAAPAIAAPLAAGHLAAPIAVASSNQYHAQDELGQYSYGYADGNSVKHESRAFDGTTHGAYSYVDGHGLVQSVKYHADALGFRAAGTNIPVAH